MALFGSDHVKGEQLLPDLEAEMVKKSIFMVFAEKLYATSKVFQVTRIRGSPASVHIPTKVMWIASFSYTLKENFLNDRAGVDYTRKVRYYST